MHPASRARRRPHQLSRGVGADKSGGSSAWSRLAGIQFKTGLGGDCFFGAVQTADATDSINNADFYFANQNIANVEMMRITSTGDVIMGDTLYLGGKNETNSANNTPKSIVCAPFESPKKQ
jgi:hypothetical protein